MDCKSVWSLYVTTDSGVLHGHFCGVPGKLQITPFGAARAAVTIARHPDHIGGSVRSAIEQVRSHGVRGMPLGDARRAVDTRVIISTYQTEKTSDDHPCM